MTNLKQHPLNRLSLERRDRWFLAILLLCSFTFSLTLYLRGTAITPGGPALATAETAKAIWESGSLSSHYARAVFEDASTLSRTTHSDVWQDVFAIDVRGNLIAKHSVISSLIAAPLFGMFGTIGFWLCQQVFFVTLSVSFYRCVRALSGVSLPWTSLLAICFFSPALWSSYTFNYDLHGVTFLLLGLSLSRTRPFLGSFAMACSVFVRPSYILLIPPLLFAWHKPGVHKRFMRMGFGAMAPIFLFLLYNTYFWGDPLVTTYSRLPRWMDGVMYLDDLSLGFDLVEFRSRWALKLWGSDGLFSQYGVILTLPCAVWMAVSSNHTRFFRACLVSAILNILFAFSYGMWEPGVSPNRFLHPSIFLFLIPFTVLIGHLERGFKTQSTSMRESRPE